MRACPKNEKQHDYCTLKNLHDYYKSSTRKRGKKEGLQFEWNGMSKRFNKLEINSGGLKGVAGGEEILCI